MQRLNRQLMLILLKEGLLMTKQCLLAPFVRMLSMTNDRPLLGKKRFVARMTLFRIAKVNREWQVHIKAMLLFNIDHNQKKSRA